MIKQESFMKKKLQIWQTLTLALVLVLALVVIACNPDSDEEPENTSDPAIDWNSYTAVGSYVFKVVNNTDQRLVAFKGSLNKSNIVGGIPANVTGEGHGFKKNTDLFSETGDFVLIFIADEQYNSKLNDLAALDRTPFARLYAFYNSTGTNETVYEINASLGGEYSLIVQPSTEWNVELRLDDADGPALGYVAKGQYNTTFKMHTGMYNVFPVIRQYNRLQNEIITTYPKYDNGRAKVISVGLGPEYPAVSINIGDVLDLSDF
jgi:hypothetical protein